LLVVWSLDSPPPGGNIMPITATAAVHGHVIDIRIAPPVTVTWWRAWRVHGGWAGQTGAVNGCRVATTPGRLELSLPADAAPGNYSIAIFDGPSGAPVSCRVR
jgi:hypothetical protein